MPQTIRLDWHGKLADGVCAKDIMLFLCATLGLAGGRYEAIEFTGSAVTALPMQERMTLSNMTAEIGGQVGLVAPDETTRAYVAAAGATDVETAQWHTDPGSALKAHHRFNADELTPQVAAPGSPTHARAVGECAGERVCDSGGPDGPGVEGFDD